MTTKELRSSRWFSKKDLPGFVHRSTLTPTGLHREDFDGRPVIGIINTWSDINPCNLNLKNLAEHVRNGVNESGGMCFEFPAISLSENLIKPTSFLYRNLLAIEAEELIRSYPVDAVVLMGGCDKTVPGLLMGAASAGVPAVVLTSGPSIPRETTSGVQGTGTTVWRFVDNLRSGAHDEKAFQRFEDEIMTTAGHCSEMGTASSVASICEALGVAPFGSSMIPAPDGRRLQLAKRVGKLAVNMAKDVYPTPRVLLTKAAFENAIATLCAVGGSTNVLVHLFALAKRVNVDLSLDDVDRIARQVPLVANVQPSGEKLTSSLYASGGIPAVLKAIEPALNTDAITVDGGSLKDHLAHIEPISNTVVSSMQKPFKTNPSIAVLKGNLAPNGAVLKATAASASLFKHTGPAYVFESVQEIASKIDDPSLGITKDTVLILRGVGPVGAMMPEWGMLPIPKYLMEQGVTDMVRISDARMSGTAYGTAILHVSPEAHIGGPLAFIQTGDIIELDVSKRTLNVVLSDSELDTRKNNWTQKAPRFSRGYRALYLKHVTQAHDGCDFDFLEGFEEDTLPEGLFNGWVGGW